MSENLQNDYFLKIMCAIQQNLQSVSNSSIRYGILPLSDVPQITQLYNSYTCEINNPDSVFQTEFLYVPKEEDIIKSMLSKKACYIGAKSNGYLVSIVKVQDLGITPDNPATPFFMPPQSEVGTDRSFFGISGMLTAKNFRGRGIVAPMITQTLKALQSNQVAGVYADCDYRNISSFNALSSFLNFIGFTDGRNGMDGEKTLYVTFYNSFSNTSVPTTNKTLSIAQETPDKACANLIDFMDSLENGSYTSSRFFLDDKSFNQIYVLSQDQRIKLQKITSKEKQQWEIGTCVARKEDRTRPIQNNGGREYQC